MKKKVSIIIGTIIFLSAFGIYFSTYITPTARETYWMIKDRRVEQCTRLFEESEYFDCMHDSDSSVEPYIVTVIEYRESVILAIIASAILGATFGFTSYKVSE